MLLKILLILLRYTQRNNEQNVNFELLQTIKVLKKYVEDINTNTHTQQQQQLQ